MANWTVTSDSSSVLNGSTVAAGDTFDLIISNVINGVYSGYHISADDFKIGGASQNPTNTWNGGNVDSGISKVVFSDVGTPGDPANTVKAQVFSSGFTASSANNPIFIDIDERVFPTGPSLSRPRSVYLIGQWEYANTGQTVSVADLPGDLLGMGKALAVETELDSGSASGTTKYAFSGSVDEGKSTIISLLTFTAASGSFYKFEPTVSFFNLGEYSNDYTSEIECTRSNGYISSFTVKTYYSPNVLASGSTEELEQLGHTMSVNYQLEAITVAVSNKITGISYSKKAPSNAHVAVARVTGTANTKFNISIRRLSVGDEAGAFWFYNFDQGLFLEYPYAKLFETDSTGLKNVYYTLADTSALDDQTYTILLTEHIASGSTLASGVSSSNTIVKYGTRSLTITPTTSTGSNFGTLPSSVVITRPVDYSGSKHQRPKYTSLTVEGGTANASNVNVTLTKPNAGIYAGMIVTGFSGANVIPHNTRVVRQVREGVIKLSNAVTLAAGTEITFTDGKSDHVPFSFTVVPNASGDALSINDGFDRELSIGGLSPVSIQTDGENFEARITLDNTTGLAPGMTFVGNNVTKDPLPYIVSVNNSTEITVSTAQTALGDNTLITFSPDDIGSSKVEFLNARVAAPNVIVEGYIKAGSLKKSSVLPLHLDNIITVA